MLIYKSVLIFVEKGWAKTLILAYSKRAIGRIRMLGIKTPLDDTTLKIKNIVRDQKEGGNKVEIVWIPGHSNSIGNAKADKQTIPMSIKLNPIFISHLIKN